jgi:hypothetical protein
MPHMIGRSWLILLGMAGCAWVSAQDHADRLGLLDRDGDGYLDAARGGDDCDDLDPQVHPGATETCDVPGDEDCNGLADAADPLALGRAARWPDADGDGYGAAGPPEDLCPQVGWVERGGDCDDAAAAVYPSAPETCARPGDDDCDGAADAADPDVVDAVTLWVDADGDTFGASESAASRCPGPGLVDRGDDCDDADAATYPGAPEACPGFGPDHDCSDVPLPCSLAADRLERVVQRDGLLDPLVAAGPYLVCRVVDKMAAWPAADPAWTWPPPVSLVVPAGPAGLAGGPEGALVVAPTDGPGGTLYRLTGAGALAEDAPRDPLGSATSWGPGECPWAVLHGPGLPTWASPCRAWGGVRTLRGAEGAFSTQVDARWWVAVTAPGDQRGAGAVQVFEGETDLANRVTLLGRAGEALGRAGAWADLDADGAPELVLGSDEGWAAWAGPVTASTTRAATRAAWATEAPVGAIAVGDFNGDGLPDVAVGTPEGLEGAGAVSVWVSRSRTAADAAPARVTVLGTRLGDRFGAGVAFADHDGDGFDDLWVTAPGEGQIWRLRGGPAW